MDERSQPRFPSTPEELLSFLHRHAVPSLQNLHASAKVAEQAYRAFSGMGSNQAAVDHQIASLLHSLGEADKQLQLLMESL